MTPQADETPGNTPLLAMGDPWREYRYGKQAGLSSVLMHGLALALLFSTATSKTVRQAANRTARIVTIDIGRYIPPVRSKPEAMGGGGGGGDRSPLPAGKGRAPRPAARQFVPPAAVAYNPAPKLVMEPTLVIQSEAKLPDVSLPNWGDPLARIGPPSNGPGAGGGIGSGSGGGIGRGKGPGFGTGEGGGIGGGTYHVGGGISGPVLVYSCEPEWSDEARKARHQGQVVLLILVDESGMPRDFKVLRALGLGLDEKAIEAVQRWRFRPARRDGKPYAVTATVYVNFRLL